MIEFRMPSLGADMEDGTLIEWKKKTGDAVKRGDCIAEVETQKGLIEIEVFDEGIIDEILIPEGTKVPVGAIMAMIKPSSVSLETKPTTLQPTEEKITEPILIENIEEKSIKVSPLARRIASDNRIDISKIKGTGEDGVITKDDVEQAIRQQKSTETAKKLPSTETIRAAVAAAMSKSNREIPHYYLEKKINITQALVWLKEQNKERKVTSRLLPVVLFIKATAKTLTGFPDLNAVWENGLQPKTSINIGFVLSLRTGGIIVPAISDANLKSIDEIMETLNDIIPRARALKLRSSELSDSTITLTSLGEGGADSVFGVIYPPQVAVIGFGSISEQPFAENGMLGIRSVVSVCLAGDHRATDGLTGSRFLSALDTNLQNPETL
nr:dihydrolipoamide acetyltransferase family protein [uncultured Flavobacterium sp.]